MDLRKVMLFVAIVGIIGIPVALFYFDYTDFSWAANSSNYLMLIVSISLIISGIGNYKKMGEPENPEK